MKLTNSNKTPVYVGDLIKKKIRERNEERHECWWKMFKVTFCRSRFLFPYPEVTGNHERAQSKEPERHAGLTVRRSSEPQGRRPFLICYSGRECLLGS